MKSNKELLIDLCQDIIFVLCTKANGDENDEDWSNFENGDGEDVSEYFHMLIRKAKMILRFEQSDERFNKECLGTYKTKEGIVKQNKLFEQ